MRANISASFVFLQEINDQVHLNQNKAFDEFYVETYFWLFICEVLGVRLNSFGTKNPSNERNFLICEENSSQLFLHVVSCLSSK